jgi:Ca2+-binding EF-hand superfamily protein
MLYAILCCVIRVFSTALADEDGCIDKSEYIILSLVRTGAASPDLIKMIIEYFETLDADHSGALDMDEICERQVATKQAVRRLSQLEHGAVHTKRASSQPVVAQEKKPVQEKRRSKPIVGVSMWQHLTENKFWGYLRDKTGMDNASFAFLSLWLIWLVVGSAFYAYDLNLGWAKGFYMAVNIGYSIGWGDISESGEPSSLWFSTVYVLCGASFIAAALGFFAQSIVEDSNNWYENEIQDKKYDRKMEEAIRVGNYLRIAKLWIKHNKEKIRSIVLWMLFIIIATGSVLDQHREWGFIEGLYFAVSSLSTGGHYSIPGNAEDWEYGLTGFYCALGVPIMGVAMATLADFFISGNNIDDTIKKVKERVTEKEVDMLSEFALADDDGKIDKAEFLILCVIRIGAADSNLIKTIIAHFDTLDTSGDGTLSMDEICERVAVQHQAERRASKKSTPSLPSTDHTEIELGVLPLLQSTI